MLEAAHTQTHRHTDQHIHTEQNCLKKNRQSEEFPFYIDLINAL